LWFTQLLWKLPWNNYGCPAGALAPVANTSGLCDWIGREIASPRWPIYRGFLESIVAKKLADDFDVSSDRINVLLGNMMRYGDVAAVLAFAEKLPGGITGRNVDEVMKIRFEGAWDDVAQNFDIDPATVAGRLSSVEDGIQTALAESYDQGRAAGGGPDESKAEPDRSEPLYQ
jgi:hypothetical protein